MCQRRSVIDKVAGGEVVGAIEDQVVLGEQRHGVVGRQAHRVHRNVDEGVDLGDRVAGAVDFEPADVGAAVDDLALQVGLLDDVEVDDAQCADAGGGQIQQRRGAQPARADDQYARVLQPLLAVEAEVGQQQVPAVAGDLGGGEVRGGFDQRRQGHGFIVARPACITGDTLPR